MMTLGLMIVACVVVALALVLRSVAIRRAGGRQVARDKVRRAGGHAMLVLQEFVEPRVEHVHHVAEERQDDEDHGAGDDPDASETRLRDDLLASLQETPIDLPHVRRQLTAARAAGLDWRQLYDESVRAVLAGQPYLSPFLPPVERVSPWPGEAED